VDAAVDAAEGYEDLTVVAREELPETIRFWARQGFREIRRASPNVELRRPLRTAVHQAPTADAMRALGRSLASRLVAGDLIVLTGSLGAGKTTFTQGLGAGLEVRGAVTSPTFVIARVHPSETGGPALVHVDAYRLGGVADVDDLDLDASTDESVTVVEWGQGLVERLADEHLEVRLDRRDDDVRTAVLVPHGPGWDERLGPG
jgi:tRNA threonylcarbamoyladenosine biosynthesis protein TsaE